MTNATETTPEAMQVVINRWQANMHRHTREVAKTRENIRARGGRMSAVQSTATVVAPTEAPKQLAGDGEPQCDHCHNMRFVTSDSGALMPCKKCGVAEARRAVSLDRYSSAIGRAATQTFHSFKPGANETLQMAARAAADFARGCLQGDGWEKRWLAIYGPTGNGKSHLCAAIHNYLRAQRCAAIFVSLPDLATSLKNLFDAEVAQAEGTTYAERLGVYKSSPVLIIDDIGAGNFTSYDEGILFEIVDHRYRNRLPTVFVSNLDMTSRKAFDARLVSRWCDKELSVIACTNAPDWRE